MKSCSLESFLASVFNPIQVSHTQNRDCIKVPQLLLKIQGLRSDKVQQVVLDVTAHDETSLERPSGILAALSSVSCWVRVQGEAQRDMCNSLASMVKQRLGRHANAPEVSSTVTTRDERTSRGYVDQTAVSTLLRIECHKQSSKCLCSTMTKVQLALVCYIGIAMVSHGLTFNYRRMSAGILRLKAAHMPALSVNIMFLHCAQEIGCESCATG